MMAMAAVKTAAGLLAARFFLGLTESGLFPGSVYLISLWYTRGEQALRNGLFFSTATMAGAFGGVLAYGIAQMDGVAGLHGKRHLYEACESFDLIYWWSLCSICHETHPFAALF